MSATAREQVLRLRVSRHHLHERLPAGSARAAAWLGLQDTPPNAAGEALAAHVADPDPSLLVARTPEPLIPPPNTSPNWYRRRR